MNAQQITAAVGAVAALEPDIAIALTAYNLLHGIWTTLNPGKTEADYQTYLSTASQTNIDTTAGLLRAHGFVETPPGSGNWAKPTTV